MRRPVSGAARVERKEARPASRGAAPHLFAENAIRRKKTRNNQDTALPAKEAEANDQSNRSKVKQGGTAGSAQRG